MCMKKIKILTKLQQEQAMTQISIQLILKMFKIMIVKQITKDFKKEIAMLVMKSENSNRSFYNKIYRLNRFK